MAEPLKSFDLRHWTNENQSLLRPPVGAEMLWKDAQLQVIIVGGPNARRDFHINPSDEFFYQLEGTMTLEYLDANRSRQRQPIRPGEVFLLPANTPHSPQRPAGSVGMVVERRRDPDEPEAYEWYCEGCNTMLYRVSRRGADLLKDLNAALEAFHASDALRTCKACGAVQEVPKGPRL